MDGRRGEAFGADREGQKSVWSFFDAYKHSGQGRAVARPDSHSFRHVTGESRHRDDAFLSGKMAKHDLVEQNAEGPDAFAFENFLTTEASKNHWFGGELSPTTEYDDWVSGADAIVEWPAADGGSPLRLAVDFTSTAKFETIYKKTDKLEGNVTVKYLRSGVETEEGRPKELRSSMPIVLLGVDKDVFREIAERGEPIGPNHPFRLLLLEQASAQIDYQLDALRETLAQTRMAKQGKSLEQVLGLVKAKTRERFRDLERLKVRVGEELSEARSSVVLDERWERVINASKTHSIFSGR